MRLRTVDERLTYAVVLQGKRPQEVMPSLTIRLTDEQAVWLDGQTRPFHNKSAVVRDLIDTARQGLTVGSKLPAYCVGAGTQITDKAVLAVEAVSPQQPANEAAEKPAPKQRISSASKGKKFEPVVSMSALKKFEEQILAFWKVKKGSKNETAWKLLQTELLKIQQKYGDTILSEQLDAGAQAGTWRSITLQNYELHRPRINTPAQPEGRHPASRVFQGGRFVDEDVPTTNPALEGLF